MTDRYYFHKRASRDNYTDPTYRSNRRRAEAFEREFRQSVNEFDFSELPESDRAVFIQWLQGARLREFACGKDAAKRAVDRCFKILRSK